MPASIRLDATTEAILSAMVKTTGRSKSDIVRHAIRHYARRRKKATSEGTAYEMIADLIGVAEGGPSDLARRSDAAFTRLLQRRRRQ